MEPKPRLYWSTTFLLLVVLASCTTTKTLEMWKEENYARLQSKVMVIAVTNRDHIRKQVENVLSYQLTQKGLEAMPSNEAFPDLSPELDRQAAEAKVRALGIESILVIRAINRKEVTNHQYGGMYFAATSVHYDGWYSYYTGSFQFRQRAYDTEYFTVVSTIYSLEDKKAVWSYLSQVKVSGSRQGAINRFVPVLVEKLEDSQLLP